MKLELKGWKAIAALAIIAAVVGGKFLMERSTLTTEATEEIKLYLRGEYVSHELRDFDLDQMTEAVHIAGAIRGGASLVHGVQMLEHVQKAGM